MGSFSNVGSQGSFQGQGSFSNINSGSLSTQNKSGSTPQFEGNLIQNIGTNALEIGANITTLIGGLLGIDQQASDAIANQVITLIRDPKQGAKDLGDALLSTYNLAVDDFGKMPLGEMVGNVLTGAWKHPVEAFLDVATLGQLTGVTKGISSMSKARKAAQSRDTLVRFAEEATKENVKMGSISQDFVREIDDIARKYVEGNIIVPQNFKQLKKELPAGEFSMPHNSYIVNLKYVDWADIKDEVVYISGSRLSISRSKKDSFFLDFTKYSEKKYKGKLI